MYMKSTPTKEISEKPTLTTEQIIARRTKAKEYIAILNSDKMKQVGLWSHNNIINSAKPHQRHSQPVMGQRQIGKK